MDLKRTLGITALLTAVLVSCAKEKTPAVAAVTTKVTLQSYRSADGVYISPVFKAGDQVKLYDLATGDSDIKTPVNSGINTSSFLFAMKNVAKGDRLAGIFPADAAVSMSGNAIGFNLPDAQDGTDLSLPMIGWTSHSGDTYSGNNLSIQVHMALIRASVEKGAYSIKSAVLTANGGEKLAGNVTLDTETSACTATSASVTVNFATPLDCRTEARSVPFFIVPGTLKSGITVTFQTDAGEKIVAATSESVTLKAGTVYDTNPASAGRRLIAAGGTKVYIFDEKAALKTKDYKSGLLWEWSSSTESAKLLRPDHIDDAKPVYDNKKMLVTSSYGWCGLVDIETKQLEFYATGLTNAHSAEILPNDRIVVACSDGFIALYNKANSNVQIAQYPLDSAHGVVWSEKKQRLYAIGASTLQVYTLNKNWTSSPELVLEKTLSSSGFVTGMHDMTAVDENTMIIGGHKLAFFNINTQTFTGIPAYNAVSGFKSINYNPATGELYYTYAWENYSEGSYDWSSHWIRYTDNLNNSFTPTLDAQGVIRVQDINMYKVRVFSW